MHLETNFYPIQSETFGRDLNCGFSSVGSPRQESCDSLTLEQFSYTPSPQHESYYPNFYAGKSSLMSATTAISGALEELQSETYIPNEEWSQTLETFLTSLQQTDTVLDICTSDSQQPQAEFNDRLTYNNLENTKTNLSQFEDIENYFCSTRTSISPMNISPREISLMESKYQPYPEAIFSYKEQTSPKSLNAGSFFNGNTQNCLHTLQQMPSPTFSPPLCLPSNIHESMATEQLMETVNEHCPTESTHLQMAEDQIFQSQCQPDIFKTESTMIKHENTGDEKIDLEETDGPKLCRWVDCNNTFPNREALSRHIERSHVDQRKGDDFTCFWSACQRRYRPFNARYKLLIHMRVHSGEKPNKCTFKSCTKAFSRLENLKIHMRSHTGERPYICVYPRCAKAFSNSSDRAKHQRTHINAKPYVCTVPGCKKCYTDPSSLRKHVKNHTAREQALAKRKVNENYLSSANYATPAYDPTDSDNTLMSIKSENEARIFPKFSKGRRSLQPLMSCPEQEIVTGFRTTDNNGTSIYSGGFGHMGEHISPPLSPSGSPFDFSTPIFSNFYQKDTSSCTNDGMNFDHSTASQSDENFAENRCINQWEKNITEHTVMNLPYTYRHTSENIISDSRNYNNFSNDS